MSYGVQWVRSALFIIAMYVAMPVFALVYLPWAIASRDGAFAASHAYCRWVCWSAGWMINLRTEVRGTPPTDDVLIAAKHQSFLDIIMIFGAVPRGKFIMKRELLYAPILGQYARRIGCVAVDRGKRGQAIQKMVADVEKGSQSPGQLIIYSQGTRVAPGVKKPYKAGTGILYEQLGKGCVPVATNVGVFWPRHGIYRKPGLAVVEFLPRIPAGEPRDLFMAKLETLVEAKSNELMAEAGFIVKG
jgi:1-acyl-sn-glycerol-3-phosphate acyltransferase